MLEKHLWRDFAAVTSSVAVLGLGVGSTLPLTALALSARGLGPQVVGWMAAAAAAGGMASSIGPAATGIVVQHFGGKAMTAVLWLMAVGLVLAEQPGSRRPRTI